ncbi:MAG: DUF3575 domain-containing protein [Muribaculaceae bacterium]|nr:DUF3575 domain-containing protein [Muribaculaceae bacterium]
MKAMKLKIMSAIFACCALHSYGQQFGIKTNLLYDATLSPSIGAELTLAPKWSMEITGSLNGWTLDGNKKWKHWFVQPETRYWLCEALHGHFFGIHALGGQYNFGGWSFDAKILGIDFNTLRNTRRQGWLIGGGVNYGYAWMLGKHWNIEAEIGVGYLYTKYDEYKCAGCGKKVSSGNRKNYVGPTEAAINMVYLF